MPGSQRRNAAGVIDRLLQEPQRFDFFQAVRLLDRWMAPAVPDGRGLGKLHFRNSLSLSFPTSEIESLHVQWRRPSPGDEEGASNPRMSAAVSAGGRGERQCTSPDPGEHRDPHRVDRIELTPAFMGLLGVSGTLPLFYTETLAQRELHHKDGAGRAFMDVFSHRAVTLFYEAWRKHRLGLQFEADQRERFLPQVLALAGLGQKSLRNRLDSTRGAVADQSLAYYASVLQQRHTSAGQLRQILQDYFGVPIHIEQHIGRWYPLPTQARTHLGIANTSRSQGPMGGVLGWTTTLGERVWQRDLRACIEFGPLDHSRFQRFLPGGPAAAALKQMLTLLCGVSLEFEVRLRLRRDDVRACALDSRRPSTLGRLGWDTFLQTAAANEDRADVSYEIHAVA